MKVLETAVRHGSARIDWVDRTGYAGADAAPPITAALDVSLSTAPADLTLVHKPGRTVLLRGERSGLTYTVPGVAAETDLARPASPTYAFAGSVRDPAGRLNPRLFRLTMGSSARVAVALYRSALGTRRTATGGLFGCCRFESGAVASWAVLELTVNPLLGPQLVFAAQTDCQGEFHLPFDCLPLLPPDAPRRDFDVNLRVWASKEASDRDIVNPDDHTAARIRSPRSNAFSLAPAFTVEPGTFTRLTSRGRDCLELREP